MKKVSASTIILCTIPLLALALTLYCLETYTAHNDAASFLVCGYSFCAFFVSIFAWGIAKETNRYATAIWIASTIVLVFVFYIGCKIPFCVVCDQVTAEDLGFLIHWIKLDTPPQ